MAKRRHNWKLQREWEEKLRAEGLGRIEDTASRTTERARIGRATTTDAGYTRESWEYLHYYEAYAQYYWNHVDDGDICDRDLVIFWLYGQGWRPSRVAEAMQIPVWRVSNTVAKYKQRAFDEYIY